MNGMSYYSMYGSLYYEDDEDGDDEADPVNNKPVIFLVVATP